MSCEGDATTGQRRLIAQVLSDATDHPDVFELHRRVVTQCPPRSAPVYRTVRRPESEGTSRHEFRDGHARYEPASKSIMIT